MPRTGKTFLNIPDHPQTLIDLEDPTRTRRWKFHKMTWTGFFFYLEEFSACFSFKENTKCLIFFFSFSYFLSIEEMLFLHVIIERGVCQNIALLYVLMLILPSAILIAHFPRSFFFVKTELYTFIYFLAIVRSHVETCKETVVGYVHYW